MNRRLITLVTALALALVVIVLWRTSVTCLPFFSGESKTNTPSAAPGSDDAPDAGASSVSSQLDGICAQLAALKDGTECRLILAKLRAFLDTLAPDVASRAVQSFLASGKNAPTPLEVTVEPGGGLGDASSLRVFLLDYLGRIDKPAAGKIAEAILSRYSTPDEWAVSLRNYAWAHPDSKGQTYLEGKAQKLLSNTEWRKNPSAGYLEAFDTVVYTRATGLTPLLAGMVRDTENKALAHAAYLTLDRLALSDPATVLDKLLKDPGLMKGREQTRANYFARADLADPKQKTLVERYLTDPKRSAHELDTFAGIFPNQNYMISNNLLTGMETPNQAGIAQRDRASLDMVEKWLADPRFQKVQPQLQVIRQRLQTFVNQSNTGSAQ